MSGPAHADQSALPLLILVAGPPACGKSTLARRLAAALGLLLLPRDPITEALADAWGDSSPDARRAVTTASFRVFYRLLREHLGAGPGVVAETNFHRGRAEADLRPLLPLARVALVFCEVPRALSFRRFAARHERGERHWSSFDEERLAQIDAGRTPEAWARARPLDLPIPLLRVDTTDGYGPDLARIVAFCRGAGWGETRRQPN